MQFVAFFPYPHVVLAPQVLRLAIKDHDGPLRIQPLRASRKFDNETIPARPGTGGDCLRNQVFDRIRTNGVPIFFLISFASVFAPQRKPYGVCALCQALPLVNQSRVSSMVSPE